MPEHIKGESREDWMSRCIPHVIKKEGLDQKEAAGKCGGMYDSWKADMSEPETYDISDVEIFAAGKWEGMDGKIYEFPQSDLGKIVNAFNELKGKSDPAIKLGHSESQKLLQSGGLPSAGWVDNLRIIKDKIIADFKKIPKEIYKIIKNGGFKRVSPEVVFNYKPFPGSKVYPRFLEAVALLGVEQKAMKSLNDFVNVYSEGNVNDVSLELDFNTAVFSEGKTYEENDNNNQQEVIDMELKEMLDEKNAELKETKVQLSESEKKAEELEKNLNEVRKEREALETENAEFKEAIRKREIETWVDEKIAEGKIPASLKDDYMTQFSDLPKDKLEGLKKIVEATPKVDFSEKSVDTNTDNDVSDEKNNEFGEEKDPEGEKIDKKIKAEMSEAKVDYLTAEKNLKERGEI